nr:PQQ-binding-like beta-propeller repeat protein [uncultured Actinotalea sp.]
MSGGSHGAVPVEVVDDAPAEDGRRRARSARSPAEAAGPAARWPARRWWVVALLGVLVVGLVGAARASAAADRRDDDDVARLAGRSGFTASLREPLEELWRARARLVGAGADVVVLVEGTSQSAQLVGRDAGTGDVRWSAAWAAPADVLGCDEAAGMLLCEVAGFGYGSPNTDEMLGEVPGRLLVVDPTTGAVVDEQELDGRTVGWAVAADDVVVARREGASLTVVRQRFARSPAPPDAASAELVWTVRLPLPDGVTANQLTLRVDHGTVVVEGVVGAVLDAGDGAVLVPPSRTAEPGLPVRVEASASGALVHRGERSATWFDRRSAPRASQDVAGAPVEQAPDDGSSPGVALVDRDGLLVAVDAASGTVLWEREEAAWRRVARVDGTVLVVEPGAVTAVEATTGEERWSRPLAASWTERAPGVGDLVLDARRVLLGTELTGDRPVAVELAGGVQTWVGPAALRGVLRPGTGAAVLLTVDGGTVAGWGRDPR